MRDKQVLMDKKGISFTLTILIVAMVLLVTAVTVMGIQQGYLGDVADRVRDLMGEGVSDIERTQLRGRCENQMHDLCDSDFLSGGCLGGELEQSQYWVCQAEIEDEDIECYELWEDSPSSVPKC